MTLAQSTDEIATALRRVPGVADAELTPDGHGPGTLRLDLAPGADEVAVALEVGRILRDRFSLGVDTGHLALVEEAEPINGPTTVQRLHLTSAGDAVTASVTLARDGVVATASASGPATAEGLECACAEATAGAAGVLLATEVTVTGVRVDTEATVEVVAHGVSYSATEPVDADTRQAVVRAVLAALWRPLAGS